MGGQELAHPCMLPRVDRWPLADSDVELHVRDFGSKLQKAAGTRIIIVSEARRLFLCRVTGNPYYFVSRRFNFPRSDRCRLLLLHVGSGTSAETICQYMHIHVSNDK